MLLKVRKVMMVIAVGAVMSLTGCKGGDDESLQNMYDELEMDYELSQVELEEANEKIADLEDKLSESSGVTEDNAKGIDGLDLTNNAESFERAGSRLKFESTLKYTDAYQDPNTSSLMLSDEISVDPSNNWVIEIDGTNTRYNHPTGIVGEISVESIDEEVQDIFLENEILKPFLETLNKKSDYTYRVYVGKEWKGMCNTALITTDTGDGIVKSGIIGVEDVAVTYCFYYDGEVDRTKSELIDSLIKSMTIKGSAVRIDS